MQMPIDPHSSKADGWLALEAIADLRCRVAGAYDPSARVLGQRPYGAVDFPGASWRDRPAIDAGSGVFLVGDRVAAPGC
jgi:hypothetical protein